MMDMNNNIVDLVPILAEEFIDYELSIDTIREYQKFFDSKKEKMGLLSNYLLNQMHDFEIISVSRSGNMIDIKINDTNYWINKEKDYQGFDLTDMVFPFHMILKNVDLFSVNKVLDNGQIVELNDYVLKGAEILYDQLISFDNKKIELGLTLWKQSENKNNYSLLLISAEKIDIIEKQETGLKGLETKT